MRPTTLLACTVLAAGLPAMSSSAQTIDAAALAGAGRGSILPCVTCHGPDGGGIGAFPRLAGMNPAYLAKQLGDYDSGTRVNAVMQPIAAALSAEERVELSRYYGAMPIPAAMADPAPTSADPGGVGAALALRGKWSAGVPACVQCHGPGGTGVGNAFPALAAQPAAYIADQLRAWQAGTRKNDPIELMRHLSAKLSDSEVQAVSDWFSLQPATLAGGSQ